MSKQHLRCPECGSQEIVVAETFLADAEGCMNVYMENGRINWEYEEPTQYTRNEKTVITEMVCRMCPYRKPTREGEVKALLISQSKPDQSLRARNKAQELS